MTSKRVLLSSSVLCLAVALPYSSGASAQVVTTPSVQTTDPAGANGQSAADKSKRSAAESIVVTGTRIPGNFTSPSPITVATSEQLQLAAPTTLQDSLNQLSIFKGSAKASYAGGATGGDRFGSIGASLLNLRNLGPQRNLVLLDGRRMMPSNLQGSVDVSNIPQNLVSRVEIVTAGASATYGSDAISGVINFILNTRYTGLDLEAKTGESTYGDLPLFSFGATYGTQLFDGRGHLILNGEYFDQKGIGSSDTQRPFNTLGAGVLSLQPGSVPSRRLYASGLTVANASPGGLILAGPLRGTTFGPGGTVENFNFGNPVAFGGAVQYGGDGVLQYQAQQASINRKTLFGRFEYDVTDKFDVFIQANYGRTRSQFDQASSYLTGSNALTIFSGNPFIPAALQQQMTALGLASFKLSRINLDLPPFRANALTEIYDIVGGFKGEIGGMTVDGFARHGQTKFDLVQTNENNFQNLYAAVDAVVDPSSGNIVCRSTLSGLSPGCAPFNPFGYGSPSAQSIAYVNQGIQFRDLTYKQNEAGLNVAGKFGLLAAGPVGVAFGGGYRELAANQVVDGSYLQTINFTGIRGGPPVLSGRSGIYFAPNFHPLNGSYNVWEGYGEIDVPLLRDLPLARLLDVNGAARYAHYSTSGGIWAWKVGVNYKPIPELRLRGTLSRDIRAPNTGELFTSRQSTAQLTITDSSAGNRVVQAQTISTGNLALAPEIGKTFTAGGVYSPDWLRGFNLSVDYFDTKVSGAITTLSAQQTSDACNLGVQAACSSIDKTDPNFWVVTTQSLNLASLRTNGVDLSAQYTHPLGKGRLAINAQASYIDHYTIKVPAAQTIEQGGCVSGVSAASVCDTPHWSAIGNISYDTGLFTFFVQERYIGPGKLEATFVQGRDIDNNHVNAVFYTDVTIKAKIGHKPSYEAFLTINNLFNKWPPLAPTASGPTLFYSNYQLYDPTGRYFTVGVRAKF